MNTQPQQQCVLSGGAIGLCAIALLRKFEQWEADAANPDDENCDFLNGTGWEDLRDIAMQARTLIRQFELSAAAFPSVPEISPKVADAGGRETPLSGGGQAHG